MKYQGHMTPRKEYYNFPITNSKEMEVYKLPVKYFQIIVRKLSKLQEKADNSMESVNNTLTT